MDRDKDLALRDLASGTSHKLTKKEDSQEGAAQAKWSNDGARLAFEWRNKEGQRELRVTNLDGSNQRVVYQNANMTPSIYGWFADNKALLVSLREKQNLKFARLSLEDGSISMLLGGSSYAPAISPDGRFIAYTQGDGGGEEMRLMLIPSGGGNETQLLKEKGITRVFGWDPEGRSVLFVSEGGGSFNLWRLEVSEGKARSEPELLKTDIGDLDPLGSTRTGSYFGYIWSARFAISTALIDLATGKLTAEPVRVTPTYISNSANPAWSPDGEHLAYLAESTPIEREATASLSKLCIWALKDGRQKEYVLRIPLSVMQGDLSWSSDGQLIFGVSRTSRKLSLVRIKSDSGELNVIAEIPGDRVIGLRPDGNTAFFNRRDAASGTSIIGALDSQSGRETELYRVGRGRTLAAGNIRRALSPDGKWLFVLDTDMPQEMTKRTTKLLVLPAGGGTPRELLAHPGSISFAYWQPDGKAILFQGANGKSNEVWSVPLDGGTPRKLEQAGDTFRMMSFHPDGKRIAYRSLGPSEDAIWVLENLPPKKSVK